MLYAAHMPLVKPIQNISHTVHLKHSTEMPLAFRPDFKFRKMFHFKSAELCLQIMRC